jgi:GT2 family glycosyltransferase
MNSTTNLPLMSVIIPNHNGAAFLANCLRSLQFQTHHNAEIIVVDNASHDKSLEIARTVYPEATLLCNNQNLGFAGAVNAGIRSARGSWIAVLNNDTEVAQNWLAECSRAIEDHPDAVFFACRILQFADRNRIYSAGDCYLRAGIGYRRGQDLPDREDFQRECRIFSASGCAALYRKEILEKLGGFDERFFAYLEDVDLGLRLQAAGCRGYYLPRAELFHHGGATSGGEFSRMAVRLRTRNSLLLLFKSLPGRLLLRCLPMIFLAQVWWKLRVLAHWRLGSYLKGLAEACFLAPAMIRDRAQMRPLWETSQQSLWQEILNSESMAQGDFVTGDGQNSIFLKFYFRLFGKNARS